MKKLYLALLITSLMLALLPTIAMANDFSIVMQGKSEDKKPKPPKDKGNGKVEGVQWELWIEIDYMVSPTQEILDYIQNYYLERGINVTFFVDDPVPFDESVTFEEHLAVEDLYNDHDEGYYSKWKWFLYGTTVEGYSNVVGYIYANTETGNYGFIATTTISEWCTENSLETWSGEAVTFMHELGHSIGILKLDAFGNEMYDRNRESVMSYLNVKNADNYYSWFYSSSYWKLRNLDYYTI